MTNNPVLSANLHLFVTHIDADGQLLRIYAQTDQDLPCNVERIMNSLTKPFNEGHGRPGHGFLASASGVICCAMFEDAYYRAKIRSLHPTGKIVVQFIDYGNTEILESSDIRLLDGIADAAELQRIPPLAMKFIVAGVLPKNGRWDEQDLGTILKVIRYSDCPAKIVSTLGTSPLINLLFNGRDFAQILIAQNMAFSVPIETQLRTHAYVQPPQLHPQQIQHSQMQKHLVQVPIVQHVAQPDPREINNYGGPREQISLRLPRTQHYQDSWRGLNQQGQPNVPSMTISPPKIPLHHQVADSGVFRSRILEVGSKHEVTVPYVEDGPLMFSVQVSSTEAELNTLMNRINKTLTPQPLVEPPVIGTVCLGRYSANKSLLRAVVGQVREHGCKIHYVDYGYVEILPYTDMYQLPREYINPRALSIRFTMSNINEVNITDETKEYFKSYVAGKKLLLHVRPSEASSLIQCGDLYDNGCSIKDILRSKFGDSVAKWPSPCKLLQDSHEIVQVVCVDASIIFVQLDSDEPSFVSMNSELAEYVITAPPLKPNQLKKGLACIALSTSDFKWYRAEIVNVLGDNVTVSYVDFGNQEIIPAASIRSIRDKNTQITKLRAQGIRCILNDYHEITSQELRDSLETEIMTKPVAMIVTKVTSDGPIVDLFDSKMEPLVNIIHRLKRGSITNGNVDKRSDPHNDKSRNCGNSNVNRRFRVKEQPNVGQHQKSKSQNFKATRDDQTNKWNNSPRSDNSRMTESNNPRITESNNLTDRGRSNNWKDDDNEQRRYDNRYQNRGNDKEWQSNTGQQQQNDRFSRNDGRNDRATRDEPRYERYDRFANDSNANVRQSGRENRENRGGRGGFSNPRFTGNNARSERQGSADKSWSDKDSDTSSRGSGRKGRRGSGSRGGGKPRRDGDGDRGGGFKNGQRTNGASARIARDNKRDFGDRNEIKQEIGNWTSTDDKTPISSTSNIIIPPPNISVGAVKNCEVVFMKDPTDFHLQLSPDNLELDEIMARIATRYEDENSGKILEKTSIKPGMSCVAQYSEDSKWYRATVKSVEGNTGANVHFVDYGNVEFVKFDKIKELEAEYAKLSSQAIACKLLAASKSTWDNTEINKFSLLTDGKFLEAEFVNQENDIYEILLRQVVDDSPATNYINDEFSDGADLLKAKNNARYKGRQGQIVLPTDYVPIDHKWSVQEPTVGSKLNVIVTWFINPENFFCQMLDSKNEFRKMMNDMQQVYASRQPISVPLQIGSAVMAVFSEDGALYRAEILELNKARGNIVRYIDFGNTAMVEPRNIYRVEKKFSTMPKQAFNCSLKNIVPANGTNWSRSNRQEIEKCFESDNFECTIHEINNTGKCIISLSNEGIDVAGSLVEKSLVSFAVSAGPVHVEKNEVDATKQPEMEQLPRFDISLLAGQVLRVRVSNVASAAKFHIQLPSANASEKLIDAYMAQNDPKVMPRISCHEVCLGAGCLVNTDEGWRRAVVVNCSRTTGFDVRLIDTGANDEIPLDCMLALPGALSVMQNQAVECCLKNATPAIVLDEKLRDTIENTDVIIAIDEVDNNRLIVKLFDVDGKKIKLSEDEIDETISPICPMPILYSTQKVSVSHAEHSSSVWLKRTADVEVDTVLLGQMFDHYSVSTGQAPIVLPETLCAAKSSDENWYRAKVVRMTESGVLVQFIDYGNTEDIPFDSVRILEKQFYSQPQLAIEIALTVSLEGSKEQQQNILQEHILDKEFIATIYNVRKKWVAELTNEEGKMSEKLGALEVVQVLKNRDVQCEISEMIVGGRYKVTCTHADSPALFWLQRNEEIPAIEQLQEKLQIEATSAPILKGIPEINTLCLAMYSVDKQWYRAVVLDADEDITSIRFIDFGNTDVVDTNMGKSKEITDSLKSIKSYAIKCRLDVIPYGGEDWMCSACEWFEAIITSVENVEALVIADTQPRRVELFVGDRSIVDDLVKRNFATKIHNEEDLLEEIIEREVDLRAAYVSHAISPSEFWIQQEKYVGDLEILADRFLVADMFPELNKIEEGMLCVAKFPEDDSWYRARVISHADTGTEVIYIDYGNSAISTEIREIPADAAAQPAFSKKCRLVLPEGVEQWSEEACVEFVKMAADGETTFQLEMIEERTDDTSIVRLTHNDKDIVESLIKLCPPRVPIIEERLPPLGEENSPNVVVSHVNSPSDFSTQAESAITELEIMSDHLAAAESFLPLDNIEEGLICAAKFPEDEQWYRARILSHGDAGTEVHYIDYGNSAITTELKVLPEDIVKKPALSTCCSLLLPEDFESWSKEACEKFFELVNDGITMFQYEILEDKEETTLIRLTIEGKDIVELLAPLCKKNTRQNGESTNERTRNEQIEIQHIHQVVESMVDRVTLDSLEQTSSNETSGVDVTTTSDNSTLDSCSKLETSTEFMMIKVSESKNIVTDLVSDVITDVVSDVANDVVGDVAKEVVSDVANDVVSDVAKEVVSDVANDVVSDVGKEVVSDVAKEVVSDVAKEVVSDVAKDVVSDVASTTPSIIPTPEKIRSLDDEVQIIAEIMTIERNIQENTEMAVIDNRPGEIRTTEDKQEPTIDIEEQSIRPKTPIMEKILPGSISRGLSEEDIILDQIERRNSVPIEDKIVPGSINKGENLSVQDSINEKCSQQPFSNQVTVIETRPSEDLSPSITRKLSFCEKIVPGSVSRGDSPVAELKCPTTPKTPHSEKLVAGVVNLQEKLADFEKDEVLSIITDENIPK